MQKKYIFYRAHYHTFKIASCSLSMLVSRVVPGKPDSGLYGNQISGAILYHYIRSEIGQYSMVQFLLRYPEGKLTEKPVNGNPVKFYNIKSGGNWQCSIIRISDNSVQFVL